MIISKFKSLLALSEAKILSPKAISLFSDLGFSEEWNTNFATGGASFPELDLYVLYKLIKVQKPTSILELGSGKSTIAITKFLNEIGHQYDFYSIDEYEKWGALTKKFLEEIEDNKKTRVLISKRIASSFQFFKGTCYSKLPDEKFDLIFVDGPDPKGGINTDVLNVLSKQTEPCNVLIDGRYRTVLAIQSAFPEAKCFKFINNMTLFLGLCATNFTENNFSHMHYKKFYGLDRIGTALRSLKYFN